MKELIKIPVAMHDTNMYNLGIDVTHEYCDAYFDPSCISFVRVANDDRVNDSNLDASCIHLTDGSTVLVYMSLNELLDLLKEHITCL